MLTGTTIGFASFLYLLLLFAVAYFGDKRADAGRSIIANPTIYALSLAVYCTTWTYYGSVGRAASSGLGFVPIFLGPTLVVALWWFVAGAPLLHELTRAGGILRDAPPPPPARCTGRC